MKRREAIGLTLCGVTGPTACDHYLTDLLLSNYYFDDDLQMLGCYETGERLHLVTSQPYVDGIHPDWVELKAGLVAQGLRDPYPGSQGGNFIIPDDLAGGAMYSICMSITSSSTPLAGCIPLMRTSTSITATPGSPFSNVLDWIE